MFIAHYKCQKPLKEVGVSFSSLVALIFCVAALAGGQLLFKLVSVRLVSGSDILTLATDWRLITALTVYASATLAWIWVLREVPLSRAYPFAALTYIIVPVGAAFFLNEGVSPIYWGGIALIIAGVVVCGLATAN
jgi:drug/metabolite transporter (DMT)-like permease